MSAGPSFSAFPSRPRLCLSLPLLFSRFLSAAYQCLMKLHFCLSDVGCFSFALPQHFTALPTDTSRPPHPPAIGLWFRNNYAEDQRL